MSKTQNIYIYIYIWRKDYVINQTQTKIVFSKKKKKKENKIKFVVKILTKNLEAFQNQRYIYIHYSPTSLTMSKFLWRGEKVEVDSKELQG